MATTLGVGIVYGTAVEGLQYTAAAEITSTGETFERGADKSELLDGNGAVQTIVVSKRNNSLKLKCYPSGAAANANALPGLYELVTVVAPNDSDIEGVWLAEKVSKDRKTDGHVEFDLSLIRYLDDAGQPTAVMVAS